MDLTLQEFYKEIEGCRKDITKVDALYSKYRAYEDYTFAKCYELFLKTTKQHIEDGIKKYGIKKGRKSLGTLFLLILVGKADFKSNKGQWFQTRMSKFAWAITYFHNGSFSLQNVDALLQYKTLSTIYREARQSGPVRDLDITRYNPVTDFKMICTNNSGPVLIYYINDGKTPITILKQPAIDCLKKHGYLK